MLKRLWDFNFVQRRSALHILGRSVATASTVDQSEIDHFKKYSKEWWDELGPMKALHSMNKLRVPFIRDGLFNMNVISQQLVNSGSPLKEISILDIGCGGGILSEALARIGGNVTGLDANQSLIQVAQGHAAVEKLTNVQYLCSSIEEHAETNGEKYDALVASEVVEHVTQKEEFLKACVRCVKPGGSVFLTTINKTWVSNFGAIFMGENVLNIVPKGSHEYDKFIQPHNLQRLLEGENCRTILVHGILYNFLTNDWHWSNFKDLNYALHAVKLAQK